MNRTHTRTHVVVTFSDPFLVCDQCRKPVAAWHDNDRCGCTATFWNDPCGCVAGVTSRCPSWGPVDGCTCPDPVGHEMPGVNLGDYLESL